jgi:hypothetical protein
LTLLADDHATGSDHEVIEWVVEVDGQDEADQDRVLRWSLAAMMEEDLEAAEKLWRELAKETAHLSAECTADKVEYKAACCKEAMSSVLNATAKKIRICAKSKRWWNAEIQERRYTVGREKTRENSCEVARAKAQLRKSIRPSKSNMWSEYFQNYRGAEVSRAA